MIKELSIANLRNLEQVSSGPFAKLNIITGANGAGKSSFLEAIHILSTGRSFRTNQINHVIQQDKRDLILFCRTYGDKQLGMKRNRQGDYQVKIDHENVERLSTIAKYLPVRLMTPESFLMLTAGSQARRHFIDFSVFHVKHQFSAISQNYQKLLKQRNAQLKQSKSYKEIKLWDKQIIPLAQSISELRNQTFESMTPYIRQYQNRFLPQYDVQYSISSGMDPALDIATAFERSYLQDRKYGHTTIGPHKADIKLAIDNTDAHQVLSRGELKMMVASLIMGQIKWLLERQDFCYLIIDDLSSELDSDKQRLLIDELKCQKGLQTFVTSIDKPEYFTNKDDEDVAMFHVKHGNVSIG